VLPDDDLDSEAASVHERRHALRQHGPWAAMDAWPSVSIIMSTHRAAHVDHALAQIAGLRYPRLEVLIAAHGDSVDSEDLRARAAALPYETTVVGVGSSRNLGETLQILSEAASGDLVTKMDDDDHYGPEHIWDLVLARAYSGAQIVGKTLDWIHLEAQGVTVFRPVYSAESYADFVCGGTMLISRGDLLSVGGWRPVPKSVDRALLDRVIDDGGLVYRTHGLGYVYVRRADGHTATVSDEHFLKKNVSRVEGLVRHREFGTL
jgi:glycosyltransferase involved in cell wall biosynthesis